MKRLLILLLACLMLTACSKEEQSEDPRLILSARKLDTTSTDDCDYPLIYSYYIYEDGTVEYMSQVFVTKDFYEKVTRSWKLSKEEFKKLKKLLSEVEDVDVDSLLTDSSRDLGCKYWCLKIYDKHSNLVFNEKYIMARHNDCIYALGDFLETARDNDYTNFPFGHTERR